MDSDQRRWIGLLRLPAHLLRRIAGIPSGPGAESSLISEIASLISSVDRTSSLSSVVIGGSANSGIDLSGQFGSLKTEQNCV